LDLSDGLQLCLRQTIENLPVILLWNYFLGIGIPFIAGGAPADPFCGMGAAILAYKICFCFHHK
jgi:hypothetical protein